MTFRTSLKNLSDALKRVSSLEIDKKASLIDFGENKKSYELGQIKTHLRTLCSHPDFIDLKKDNNPEIIETINALLIELRESFDKKDINEVNAIATQLTALDNKLVYQKTTESLSFKLPKIPSEIKEEMQADLRELQKCFESGCFRACVILCGRILEIALHRVYFEKTGNDLLEKAPGTGLGNLIAKMKEKDIAIDPALTQQIHLINQVRIYSVHKKQESFTPSKDQAHAIILYTLDIIRKLFA